MNLNIKNFKLKSNTSEQQSKYRNIYIFHDIQQQKYLFTNKYLYKAVINNQVKSN